MSSFHLNELTKRAGNLLVCTKRNQNMKSDLFFTRAYLASNIEILDQISESDDDNGEDD